LLLRQQVEGEQAEAARNGLLQEFAPREAHVCQLWHFVQQSLLIRRQFRFRILVGLVLHCASLCVLLELAVDGSTCEPACPAITAGL
jgi:hypothetical protein